MKPSLKDNSGGYAKPVNGSKPPNTKSIAYADAMKKLRPKDRKKLKGIVKHVVKTKRGSAVKLHLKKGAKL